MMTREEYVEKKRMELEAEAANSVMVDWFVRELKAAMKFADRVPECWFICDCNRRYRSLDDMHRCQARNHKG